MTDFRALCAELVDDVEVLLVLRPPNARTLWTTEERLTRARAALAEPEAEEPTIPSRYRGHEIAVYRDGFHAGYKEALTITDKLENTND